MKPNSPLWKILEFYGTRIKHPGKWRVHEFLRSILRADRDCELEVERQGLRWRLNPSDFVQKHLFWLGEYEYHDLRILSRWLRPGAVVFDVGANFGYYSLNLASALNGKGHVYAFEPSKGSFSRLQENINLNNLQSKITASRLGLSESGGAAFLHHDPTNSGAATVSHKDEGETISIDTLDNFCRANKIPRVDVIKIDVEGHELQVIKGGTKFLSLHRPAMMIEFNSTALEASGQTVEALAQAIRGLGYELRVAHRDKLSPMSVLPKGLVVMNVFCVPK